jgi:hypothetical protein
MRTINGSEQATSKRKDFVYFIGDTIESIHQLRQRTKLKYLWLLQEIFRVVLQGNQIEVKKKYFTILDSAILPFALQRKFKPDKVMLAETINLHPV